MPRHEKGRIGTEKHLLIFKWAENNAQGIPEAILEELMERDVPSAIQPFNPEPFEDAWTRRLSEMRQNMELLLWVYEKVIREGQVVALKGTLHAAPVKNAMDALADVAVEHGLTVFDDTACELVGRPKHFVLKLDNRHGISGCDPTPKDVVEVLDCVNVKEDIGFASLENHRGDFVQVFGTKGEYAVEWRTNLDPLGNTYRHLAAGRKPAVTRLVSIGIPKRHITKFASEVLTLEEVNQIFAAFHRGEEPPAQFHWRDMTEEIPK